MRPAPQGDARTRGPASAHAGAPRVYAAAVACAAGIAACAAAPCPAAAPAQTVTVAAQEPAPERPPTPRQPDGFVAIRVLGAIPSAEGWVLLLQEPGGTRVVPIIIGEAEASAINRRLSGESTPRPMTHDLLERMLQRLGAAVVSVEVNKIAEGVFIGTISVWDGHGMQRIDSRTSDAVAVAVGRDVPIYVAVEVIDESGVELPEDPAPVP